MRRQAIRSLLLWGIPSGFKPRNISNQVLLPWYHFPTGALILKININEFMMASMEMDIDKPNDKSTKRNTEKKFKSSKSHEIYSTTIKTPRYAYAQLELITTSGNSPVTDDLTFRQYLTSALKQFLGITGSAIPVDLLKVSGRECWVRVPREDLGAFAAAMTAWAGSGPSVSGFRTCAAGDWLGALVGRHDQRKIWGES